MAYYITLDCYISCFKKVVGFFLTQKVLTSEKSANFATMSGSEYVHKNVKKYQSAISQLTFTYSKSIIETLEKR